MTTIIRILHAIPFVLFGSACGGFIGVVFQPTGDRWTSAIIFSLLITLILIVAIGWRILSTRNDSEWSNLDDRFADLQERFRDS